MTGVIVMIGCVAIGLVSLMIGIRIGRSATNHQWIQTVVQHGVERAMSAHGYELQGSDDDTTAIEATGTAQLSLPTFDDDDTEV